MINSNVHLQKLTAMSLSAHEQMDKATLLARVVCQHWRRQGNAWVFLGIPKISAQKINTYTKIHVYSIF